MSMLDEILNSLVADALLPILVPPCDQSSDEFQTDALGFLHFNITYTAGDLEQSDATIVFWVY